MTRPSPFFERHRRTLGQFVRFGLVGGSGVLVNMVVAVIMTKLNGGTRNDNRVLFWITSEHAFRYTVLVWIVAFVVANFWNFELNRRWAFKSRQHASWWSEFWPFFVVGSVAAGVGAIIKVALTNPTSPLYLPHPPFNDDQGLRARAYWAQLITIVITMPINFVVNKLWTFRAVRSSRMAAHAAAADQAEKVGR
ncbi:GtrA family protein [Aestuariimicrobium ganziense]|uniref:GtrA family protein n=1 Tax=Aestuariimicrobium ganziense TaxID=2773677 RepID=UPI001942E330|nr:GtrA family protein [Aestuariimicrobium ganziense]